MATKTLLKSDGIYVHEDYTNGKAAKRLNEFSSVEPAQSIRRNSNGSVETVLVSKSWWDTRIAAFTAAPAPVFAISTEVVTDDYLGKNIATMSDLIRGKSQTKALTSKVVNEGISQNYLKVYAITTTKEYEVDNRGATPTPGDGIIKGGAGSIKAYMIHPDHYAALSATPVATSYIGTGDGTISVELKHGGAVAETLTITCTATAVNGGTFGVVGSVSGPLGSATVGTTFECPQAKILITDGATDFVLTDEFVVTSYAL